MIENLIAIATLILLEGILSVDNALAMALQVRALDPSRRRRALLYGLWGAMLLRAGAIVGAKWLMSVWWLEIAGALYLLYLVIAHFARRRITPEAEAKEISGRSFWIIIAMVELTDAAFALDSTLVAVGMSNHLWVIFTGVAVGILTVRYAALLFVKLLQRCPELEHLGFVLMGWVAVRLFSHGWEKMSVVMTRRPAVLMILPDWLFWTGVAILIAIGGAFFLRRYFLDRNRRARGCVRLMIWRRRLMHRSPLWSAMWRFAVMVIGAIVLLIGIAMIFLPGPAVIVIPMGLAILATEFAWARELLTRGRASWRNFRRA
jgi:YkoY family integral membrane protein